VGGQSGVPQQSIRVRGQRQRPLRFSINLNVAVQVVVPVSTTINGLSGQASAQARIEAGTTVCSATIICGVRCSDGDGDGDGDGYGNSAMSSIRQEICPAVRAVPIAVI
jgi:hypothetical protein